MDIHLWDRHLAAAIQDIHRKNKSHEISSSITSTTVTEKFGKFGHSTGLSLIGDVDEKTLRDLID